MATAPAPAQWPALNGRVSVHVQLPDSLGGQLLELPTRVEDSGEDRLVVAAPSFTGDLHLVGPGLAVTVSWASERGRLRQDFVVGEVVRRRVACWDLVPVGELTVQQRRRYVRVPLSGGLRLLPVPGDPAAPAVAAPAGEPPAPEEPAAAAFIDLSEGGACVRLRRGAWPAPGRLVRAVFDLDGGPVDQLAEVVRAAPGAGGAGEHDDLVLVFVEPVAAADRLRRHVMQVQIRNRRREEP
ncbi:PilZ domain-containing protein [Kineococcus gypseus]|uniref:PilZ domain-containing protein n=1 Tax=Kineococcus gypseus TaxID=1637102 RepID=UPI003D7DBABD